MLWCFMHDDDELQSMQHATAQPLPTLGEGCLQRYDPEYLSDEHGADFSNAVLLSQLLFAQYNPESMQAEVSVTGPQLRAPIQD